MYSQERVATILKKVQQGSLSPEEAYKSLQYLPYEDLHCARLDHHRRMRTEMPEVVFAPGKTLAQLRVIIPALKKAAQGILITRLEEKTYKILKKNFPFLSYSREGRIAFSRALKRKRKNTQPRDDRTRPKRFIAVITAGTSDIPVAEEASVTLEVLGCPVKRFYDCGVAGIHRVLDIVPVVRDAEAIICVAGMEGALPSVVAGLLDVPVVAVPTSIGYGASFGGVTPLLAMLNSCATGVAVMNIDNGFGAACFARMIWREKRKRE
jgi:pyridinium-3,5-biscarboxylic acid mononucleotide synthase